MKNNNKKLEKESSAADYSADSVEEYLQRLGSDDATEQRYYSQ